MKQFLQSSDFLKTVVVEAEKNSDEARSLVAGLSQTQLNWTADPNAWSIAQCLDHLATTSKAFDPYFTVAIKRGRDKWPVRSAIPYRPSWVGGWLIRQVVPVQPHGKSHLRKSSVHHSLARLKTPWKSF